MILLNLAVFKTCAGLSSQNFLVATWIRMMATHSAAFLLSLASVSAGAPACHHPAISRSTLQSTHPPFAALSHSHLSQSTLKAMDGGHPSQQSEAGEGVGRRTRRG